MDRSKAPQALDELSIELLNTYMRNPPRFFIHSFTTIELIIVISIMLLFAGISLSSYNVFTEQQKLKSDVEKIVDVLEFAKKKAHARDVSLCSPFGSTPVIESYIFSIRAGDTSYQIAPNCMSATPTPIMYQLENTNTVSPNTGLPRDIAFYSLTNTATATCLLVKNSILNTCRYITVSSSGTIETDTGCSCP